MYIKEISGSDFEENLDYFTIIDVRSPEEYNNGHVKGAINYPTKKFWIDAMKLMIQIL